MKRYIWSLVYADTKGGNTIDDREAFSLIYCNYVAYFKKAPPEEQRKNPATKIQSVGNCVFKKPKRRSTVKVF